MPLASSLPHMSCSLSTSGLIYDPCPLFQQLVKHPAADLWGMPCPSTGSRERKTCFLSYSCNTQVPFLANATHQWDVHTSFKFTYHNISLKAQTHKVSKWVEVSNCKMVSKCLQAPPTPTVPMAASSSSSKLFSVVRALLSLVRRSSMASSNLYSNMQLAPPSCGRARIGSKAEEVTWHCLGTSSSRFTRLSNSLPSGKLT